MICLRNIWVYTEAAIKTVLVIEDHPGDRDIYGKILWYNGFHVLFAEDGEAGLKLAQERHPDLILLDLELPRLHGSELCSQLKQDNDTADIPVVALTGRRLDEFGGNARVLGYACFLEKPVSPLRVLKTVEALIGRADRDQAMDPAKPETFRSGSAERHDFPQHAEGPALHQVGEHLIAHADQVMQRWEQLTRQEPWFTLPPDDRLNDLATVVEAMAHAALISPESREARADVVRAAVEHGATRRGQGCGETTIPIELQLLGQAISRELMDRMPPAESVFSAIRSLDDFILLATNASMWGYFREEIEAQGVWDVALERLVSPSQHTHS